MKQIDSATARVQPCQQAGSSITMLNVLLLTGLATAMPAAQPPMLVFPPPRSITTSGAPRTLSPSFSASVATGQPRSTPVISREVTPTGWWVWVRGVPVSGRVDSTARVASREPRVGLAPFHLTPLTPATLGMVHGGVRASMVAKERQDEWGSRPRGPHYRGLLLLWRG